jgi:PmbA protein
MNNEILDYLRVLTETILKEAKNQGATETVVHAMQEEGFSVGVRMQEVERVEYHRNKNIGVTVYFDKRKASVTTSETSAESIKEMVKKACSIAQYTQEDSYSGLPDAELMAKNIRDLSIYHPWEIAPEAAINQALLCEKQALSVDKCITNSEGVDISTNKIHVAHGNSHGFLTAVSSTRHSASCVLIAEQNNEMERDSSYTTARDAGDLMDMNILASIAAEKTLKRLGARKLSTRKVPIIFKNEVARGLVKSFLSAINGHHLYKKSSFLLDHLDKKIFPSFVHIHENPFVLKGLASTCFDGEGVATSAKDFIKGGVLQSYILDVYAARKLNLHTTGNAGGVYNLFVDSTLSGGLSALCKQMGTGLLVTDLMGQGVNLVTGDYSRGASGFWVESGEIQYPVSEITIAGNLKEMFQNLIAISDDIDLNSSIHTGSILLEEMTIAGE